MSDYSQVSEKLLQQKNESISRISELKMSDPFNIEVSSNRQDDGVSPDDMAQDNEIHERISSQIYSLEQLVSKIDMALQRIEDSTYGVCEVCKNPIDATRLSIMPFAATCLPDEKKFEQLQKKRAA